MDESSLRAYFDLPLRAIFRKRVLEKSEDDAVNPRNPSLDAELPEVHRPERSLHRPPWDPRDRWRRMLPSQPLHAPPESDLPAQFRYEDLSVYEKSETMGPDQDRLLNWLAERFYHGLEFKYTGQPCTLTADEAIREQVFTQLQILDEQLQSLGLSSADQSLLDRRSQLLEAANPAAAAINPVTTTVSETDTNLTDTWEQETNEFENEFSKLASPQQPKQQVVNTVHELETKHQRRRQPVECGDLASDNTFECHVDIWHPEDYRHHHGKHPCHRVGQFGDIPIPDVNKPGKRMRMPEDAV